MASPASSSLEQHRAKRFSPSHQPNITAYLPSLQLPQVLSLGIRVMEQARLPLGHETGPGASSGDILPPPPRGTRAVGHNRGDLDPALHLCAPCCREGQAQSRVRHQPGVAQEAKDESCSGDGRRNLGEAPGRWPGLARSSLDVSLAQEQTRGYDVCGARARISGGVEEAGDVSEHEGTGSCCRSSHPNGEETNCCRK